MPFPTKAQIQAAPAVADNINKHLCARECYPDTDTDHAAGALGDDVVVRIQPVREPYGTLDETTATFDPYMRYIRVALPILGCQHPKAIAAQPAVQQLVATAIAHEITHQLQCAANPTSFLAAHALQTQLDAIPSPTPADHMALYYGVPEELEAHAVQTAADIYLQGTSAPTQAGFVALLGSTHVYQRIMSRLAPHGQTAVPGLAQWQANFEALAWQAYSSW